MYYQTGLRTDATNYVGSPTGYSTGYYHAIQSNNIYTENNQEQTKLLIWHKRRELTRKGIEASKKRHEKFPFMKEQFKKPFKQYRREPRMIQRFAVRNQVIQ